MTKIATLCALRVIIAVILGVGLQPTPMTAWSESMSEQTSQLIGDWEKITRSACSQIYPDSIQFQEGGLYFGQKDLPCMFTQWDVGTYEIVGPNQIKISTANDAIIAYKFSISNDILTFVDPDGCEFKYQKVK
ncbi:MAG: hypothetical protein HZB80_10020 [Deltaproteobacteria bacterium]|nr:hypothetical protein [Deltaproteobacteria bacterium]